MMEMAAHIRKSLSDAGIGKTYHERTLADAGKHGEQLKEWLEQGGGNHLKYENRSLILDGFSRTSAILLARGLHLSGYGVRVLNMTTFVKTRRGRGERWEDILDSRALFLLPAQNERECPLSPWDMEDTEEFVTKRASDGQSIILCFDAKKPVTPWWSENTLSALCDHGCETLVAGGLV